ncbi:MULTISPECIES: helix-turn-helix domain-containing protein [unclassified Aureispira]|uniref:helix-turn-helix domain-containing protein n=1 Tax=unclassified Aureispira TaxID=2649989 RepID=UPI000697E3B6|nr:MULTISPECIES: helix-turn-helix domain-containing protein [unclassified Aureispira]WMX17063.1 helix-turn-helix domain-containing protein [Aureispira sp. CCB-E]WMX17166.1 helix-turn-helix domain-containing protein [Aureispira sp. CCB-E]
MMDQNFVEALKLQLKAELRAELREELKEEVKDEIKEEVKEEFKEELKLLLIKDKSIINTAEAAHLLGLQPRTVRKLNEEGKLNGRKYKKSGYLFFVKQEVEDYQTDNLRHAASFP